MAIWLKVELLGLRSSLKPVSLLELSVQVRWIAELEVAAAVRPDGAAGMEDPAALVVALAVLEKGESPDEFTARIR